jgi:hypothetical protein
MEVRKMATKDKKQNQEYKPQFLAWASKCDRKELQEYLHANTKPPKKIKVWSLVRKED